MTVLFALLSLLGCRDDETPAPRLPDLPTAGCGSAAYDWLPPDSLGAVVELEEEEDWALSATNLDALLGLVDLDALAPSPYGARGARLRYTTQDKGVEVEATAMIAAPDPGPAGPLPTLLYLHPTTGMEDHCAPSGRDLLWTAVPLVLASRGYLVVAPDYLGQNGFGDEAETPHPYLAADPAAVATLDAVRAAWGAEDLPVLGDNERTQRLALFGASQGAHHALWAQRAASELLPEAELDAVVVSSPPGALDDMMRLGLESLRIGTAGSALILHQLNEWHGGLGDVRALLNPDFLPTFDESLYEDCPEAKVPDGVDAVTDVWDLAFVEETLSEGLADPWACMLEESSVGHPRIPPAPETPILYVYGDADEVSNPSLQAAEAALLCAQGYDVETLVCAGGGHTDTVLTSVPRQLDWLAARLAGEPLDEDQLCAEVAALDCAAAD
ncbi:lipase family protein [Myxococcota bacterium]|nr:lipase family protein [Myxococcota bacterium]